MFLLALRGANVLLSGYACQSGIPRLGRCTGVWKCTRLTSPYISYTASFFTSSVLLLTRSLVASVRLCLYSHQQAIAQCSATRATIVMEFGLSRPAYSLWRSSGLSRLVPNVSTSFCMPVTLLLMRNICKAIRSASAVNCLSSVAPTRSIGAGFSWISSHVAMERLPALHRSDLPPVDNATSSPTSRLELPPRPEPRPRSRSLNDLHTSTPASAGVTLAEK